MSASQRLEFVTELGRHYDAGLQLGQSSSGKVEVEVVESSVIFFSLSLSVLMAFLGEPGLVGFIEAKDDGSGGDNWSYKTCKAPVKLSPATNQHLNFYRPDALSVTQSTV